MKKMRTVCLIIFVVLMTCIMVGCGGFTAGDNPSKSSGGGEENVKRDDKGNESQGVPGDSNESTQPVGSTETPKEKITISVIARSVLVNDEEEKLEENQTWEGWFDDFFSAKDLDKIDVYVDYAYGDADFVKDIQDVLDKLKIVATEIVKTGN